MITEFTIENFRLFDHLHLPKLSRVNLIVGKNSVGKSAVLEALNLHLTNVDVSSILSFLENRNENWQQSNFIEHSFRHLFNERKIPDYYENEITLKSNIQNTKIFIAPYITDQNMQLRLIPKNEFQSTQTYNMTPHLSCEINGTTYMLHSLAMDIAINSFSPRIQIKTLASSCHLTPSSLSLTKLASMWDNIALTGLDDQIIKGLSFIEPTVTGISFISVNNSYERIPVVKLSKNNQAVSLKSLGDGMVRMFQIILSLVNSKNGSVLIDEFETGLHWSVQQKAWDMVFKLAEKLNVQVFCTTHSKDCVESFEQVWSEAPEQGSFYRIYRNKDEQIKVQGYDNELLSDSVDTDTEVR